MYKLSQITIKNLINSLSNYFKKKKIRFLIPFFLILLIWFFFSLPNPLFQEPTSTIIEDKNGELLAATIASDEQWRFPHNDSVPEKFKQAIIAFEDQYFYKHPGVNPGSFVRAIKQNLKAGEIVSGGSTLTMQVIRLSRKGKPRTVWQKLIECILALRAEMRYTKDKILSLYASNAPFGGNVVGLDAAAWRYYKRPPTRLSWAETAALAVLPNSPSLIYPGKNTTPFRIKRNRLLKKLNQKGIIGQTTYELALAEPLPGAPRDLPQTALHLLNRAEKDGLAGHRIKSTLNIYLQNHVQQIINRHQKELAKNEIHNAAALVLDIETGDALAYIGNTHDPDNKHSNRVDVIDAPRSSGSILKPILYASMLKDGELLPATLVRDVPTDLGGFTPKNFDRSYAGAVHADVALYRSLNVPAVWMLQHFGLDKFYHQLKKLELSTINKPADHYGLSIILGGCEVTLWEITGVYASMARTLNHFPTLSSTYYRGDFHSPNYIYKTDYETPQKGNNTSAVLNAASIYLTFEALQNVRRPREEAGWQFFQSSDKIAWKTGTSFGFRDAWAIGVTPEYAIGVWAGNADGEGRPGLTGVTAAAPILFDIFDMLTLKKWFNKPFDELIKIPVCQKSGFKAGQYCKPVDSVYVPAKGLETPVCPYHKLIHLDKSGKFQANSKCADVYKLQHKPWFVLPPVMEWFYKRNNPDYRPLPPFAPGCRASMQKNKAMDIVFPKNAARVFVPVELDGSKGKLVFKIAHRNRQTKIFWHLDRTYIGQTIDFHEMELDPVPGKHTITLVDEHGEVLVHTFVVLTD